MEVQKAKSDTRINTWLAQRAGLSRRAAERVVLQGQVLVNGKKIHNLATRLSAKDQVLLRGRALKPQAPEPLWVAFYKPKNVICTKHDPKGRVTVCDFFKNKPAFRDLFPVGRLDGYAEGLIFMTSDGPGAHKILHPRHQILKTYLVRVSGAPTPKQCLRLQRGVQVLGSTVRAQKLKLIKPKGAQNTWVKISIGEGKNRQLHRMFNTVGLRVLHIRRIGIGGYRLKNMKPGTFRKLAPEDMKRVFQRV